MNYHFLNTITISFPLLLLKSDWSDLLMKFGLHFPVPFSCSLSEPNTWTRWPFQFTVSIMYTHTRARTALAPIHIQVKLVSIIPGQNPKCHQILTFLRKKKPFLPPFIILCWFLTHVILLLSCQISDHFLPRWYVCWTICHTLNVALIHTPSFHVEKCKKRQVTFKGKLK